MRLGLIGLGRIGAFHADTLSHLDGVDSLVVTDAVPAVTTSVAETVRRRGRRLPGGADRQRRRRDRHRRRHRRPHRADPGRRRRRHPGVLREAALRRRRRGRRHRRLRQRQRGAGADRLPAPLRPGVPRGPRRRGRAASSAGCTPCGRPPWTRRRRRAAYIAVSGGIFRDCCVHDFDTVRWVTGREVVEVYATGSARGDDFFAEFGDVATAQTLLTFDDGATAVVSNTRYNPRGYDVRLELHGTEDSVAAGWSDNTPLRNLEPGVSWPAGTAWPRSSWTGSPTPSAPSSRRSPKSLPGNGPSPCTVDDALAVDLDRRGRHPFPATAPPGADRRGPQ